MRSYAVLLCFLLFFCRKMSELLAVKQCHHFLGSLCVLTILTMLGQSQAGAGSSGKDCDEDNGGF